MLLLVITRFIIDIISIAKLILIQEVKSLSGYLSWSNITNNATYYLGIFSTMGGNGIKKSEYFPKKNRFEQRYNQRVGCAKIY